MIEAIKIIYDKSNIKEQYFWTELFQLTGICTYTITQKQVRSFKNRNSYDYDAVLILIQNIKPEEIKYLKKVFPDAILVDDTIIKNVKSLNMETNKEKEIWKKYLHFWLDVIESTLFDEVAARDNVNALKTIGDIYIKHNLAFHRIASISFMNDYYQTDLDIQQAAQDHIVNAYVEMTNMKFNYYIYLYAMAYLGRCMNDTCKVLKHRQLLNDEKCVKLLDTALKQEPGYTIAYWLKAVISENSNSSKVKNDAIGNYYMMLRRMEHKEYACEQLYFYARYLKKMQKRNDEAFKYYEKAQYFNPVEYKSLCHMGKLQMEKKEHRLADIILDEAKKIILEKERYMTPIDYAYYDAIYADLEFLYGRSEGAFNIDKYTATVAEKEKIKHKLADNIGYYEIFGTKGDECLKLTSRELFPECITLN